MFLVDTNVLVYAANEESHWHPRASRLLQDWRHQESAWYVTWGILYEFLRVTTHPRVMARPWTLPEAWGFIQSLLSSAGLDILVHTERHADVAAEVLGEVPHVSGNLVHDLHIAILMREHGIRRIYTRDTDFHRFPFLEPIDPLA